MSSSSSSAPVLADPTAPLSYPIAAVDDSDDDSPCITVDRRSEGEVCLRMNRAVADALRAYPDGIFILVSAGDTLKHDENPGELLVPVCLDSFVADGSTQNVLKRLRDDDEENAAGSKKLTLLTTEELPEEVEESEEVKEEEEAEHEDVEDSSEEHERYFSRFTPIITRLLKAKK